MKHFKSVINSRFTPWVVCILVSLPALVPLFSSNILWGHDCLHAFRLFQLHEVLKHFEFPVRWYPHYIGGYGNPEPMFYAPLFYYMAEFVHLTGFSWVKSVNIAGMLVFVSSGLAMYLFARDYWGKTGAIISAIAYVYAPYHILDVYVRGAWAEFTAFAWFPLILWSFFRLIKTGNLKYVIYAALTTACLLLTHNITAMIFMPVVFLYVFFIFSTTGEYSSLKYVVLSFILGLGVSSFFWLPALLEKKYMYMPNMGAGNPYDFRLHFVYLKQLFYSKWDFGGSCPGDKDTMSFQIGLVQLLLTLFSVFVIKKTARGMDDRKQQVFFFLFILLASVFFMLPVSLKIWENISLMAFIQFPWRLLALSTLAVAFLSGAGVLLFKRNNFRYVFAAIAIALILLANFRYIKIKQYYPASGVDFNERAVEETIRWTGYDYGPIWVKSNPEKPAYEKISVLHGDVKVITSDIKPQKYVFNINVKKYSLLQVNTFWFPNWKVWIDEKRTKISYNNEYGLIRFDIAQGNHKILVKFTSTLLRKIADTISLVCLVVLVLVGINLNAPNKNEYLC